MATMARARELLVNFPSGLSQGFLALVASGYATYIFANFGTMFGLEGLLAEEDEKRRRREQYIREAVDLRAAAAGREPRARRQ